MDPTYLIIAAVIIVLPFVLTKLFSGKSRDTDKVAGAYTAEARSPAAPGDHAALTHQVRELLAQGRKIDAVRLVREKTGSGLAAAKEAVETMGEKGRPALSELGMMSTVRLAQELGNEVHHLVAQGQKVEAIKLVRERTGLGLKEAKDIVDQLG